MTKPSSKDPPKGLGPHLQKGKLEAFLKVSSDPVGSFKIHCPECGSTHLFQTVAKIICLNCGFEVKNLRKMIRELAR